MLIAHYKLDGDATDSSGNGYTLPFINSGGYTTGKIGQSLNVTDGGGRTSIPLSTLGIDALNGQWSISLWAKPNYTGWTTLNERFELFEIGNYYSVGQTSITLGRHEAIAGNTRLLLGTYDNQIGKDRTQRIITDSESSDWIFFSISFDGTKIHLYIIPSKTGTVYYNTITKNWTSPFADNLYLGGYGWDVDSWRSLIDDVRIYNHALSQKEVKELSRAKVLHYDFDSFQEPTTNILPNPIGFDATNWAARENVTVTTEQEDPFGGTDAIRIHPLSAVDSYFGSRNDILTIGTYSTSVWLKATKDTTVVLNTGTRSVSGAYITYTALLTTYWKLFTYTGTTTAEPVHAFHVGGWNTWTDTSFDVFMAFPQVEQKDHATPFVNGSRIGIVRDISGYNNDATLALATTPQWTSDSKIGEGCYRFNGNNKSKIYNTNIGILEKYTISFWAKSTIEGKMPIGSCGSLRNTNFYWYWDNSWKYIHGGVSDEYYYTHNAGLSSLGGSWGHFCVSYDGTKVTIYRNAINEGSKNTTGTADFSTGFSIGYGYIGSSYDFQGDIDDVRIYATALNSADILELYQTRAQIDKNGNMFAINFEEADDAPIGDLYYNETEQIESMFNLEDIY